MKMSNGASNNSVLALRASQLRECGVDVFICVMSEPVEGHPLGVVLPLLQKSAELLDE
jgi:hypothetical protein